MFRCRRCGAFNRAPLHAHVPQTRGRAVCGRCKAPLDLSGTPQAVSSAVLASALYSCPVPVLVEFSGPRRVLNTGLGPTVDEVARDHAGTLVALRIDTAQDPVPAIVHGIRGARTFVLFRHGREVTRCRGPLPRVAFEKWVHSVAARARRAFAPR